MKTRAIISMMIVPNMPPIEPSTLVVQLLLFATSSMLHFTLPLNVNVTHPKRILFWVSVNFPSEDITFRIILLFVFPAMPIISHHGHPGWSMFASHFCTPLLLDDHGVALWSMATTTSPNERESHTRAGTNARPINSFISKLSLFSFHQKNPSPITYFSVMSGENIA